MSTSLNSLYLHFPYCKRTCNYCDFHKSAFKEDSSLSDFHHYLSQSKQVHQELEKEYELSWGALETFYIGGGSPSLWKKKGLEFLTGFLSDWNIHVDSRCEFTMEANPSDWTKEDLLSWKSLGMNRLSIGIQAMSNPLLLLLERTHTAEQACRFLELVASSSLNFSVDLMLGLPLSEKINRSITTELETLFQFEPDHVSLYILKPPPNYKLAKELPSDDWIKNEYLAACSFLRDKGLIHYEVSNFARATKQSRHNLRYWNHQGVAALGPSAVGFFKPNEQEGIRYTWQQKRAKIDMEELSSEEMALEKFYLKMRTNEGLKLRDYFDGDHIHKILPIVEDWKNKSLVYVDNDSIYLSDVGFLLMDTLIGQLLSFPLKN